MKRTPGSAIDAVARPVTTNNGTDQRLVGFTYSTGEPGENIKKIYAETALALMGFLPDGPERRQALDKLLESRVAALRKTE